MVDDTARVLARARELATEVLAPAAMQVEASQQVPPAHLDLLAAAGFYGLAGPREAGGLDLPPPATWQVIETLAGACLSTTFVWDGAEGPAGLPGNGAEGAAWRNR